MLNGKKFDQMCRDAGITNDQLVERLTSAGMDGKQALTAVRNWRRGLYKPQPSRRQIKALAEALNVSPTEISQWTASYRYAPMSPRKARLVTALVAGRSVQDALDLLTFTPKRAAEAVKKTLQNAISMADEQEADKDSLYVMEARVDQAGRRLGTKGWRAKDRGRAHPIRKEASHIHITVAEA